MGIFDFFYDVYAGIRYSYEIDERPEDKMKCRACNQERKRKDCSSNNYCKTIKEKRERGDPKSIFHSVEIVEKKLDHNWDCIEAMDFQCKKCNQKKLRCLPCNGFEYGLRFKGCPKGDPHLWKRV